MGKRIFWIFILTIAAVTTAAVLYIQSESFAALAKQHIQKRVTHDLGIRLGFDRLKIGVLPPSLALLDVNVKVESAQNALGLDAETVFKADRLGFTFRMIQAFSGGISINKLFLSDAEIRLDIPKGKAGGGGEKLSELVHRPIKVKLGEGFYLNIRQLELRNTMLDLGFEQDGQSARVFVRQVGYLAVTPSDQGTDVVANLSETKIMLPKVKETVKELKLGAFVRKNLILISSLDVQRKEAVAHASGKLVGSVDKPNELRPDVDLILRGPIGELADFEKGLHDFEGDVLLDAKVVGRVRDPAVQGKLEVSRFRHSLWSVDKLEAAGSYGSGSVILDSLAVQAGGGKIALGNKLELPIPFRPEPKSFQLKLSGVKFQDVAGDLRRDVNNLRFESDGTLGVRLDFAGSGHGQVKLGSLSLRPELAVKELELNNQSFGKQRPYKRIFKVAPFRLAGNVQWRPGEVRVSDTKMAFPTGTVDVRGTVTDAGFDLYGATERVDFGADVGEIAGIPVAGEGSARIHVHGPAKAVLMDFDLRQRNARFVNFDFGEISGRVTYDDRRSYLTITDLKGQKGSAVYTVSGEVNVGEGDDLSLSASFEQGSPDDLFAIFAHQLKDISWIPRGMTGSLTAKARVGGGYDGGLNTLEIESQVRGKNLSYLGEMVQELTARAGLSKATIYAHDVTARKYETTITGSLDYKIDADLKYALSVERGKLRNLDFLAAWGLPLDGLFRFHSEGKGRWDTLESASRFEVFSAFARTKPLPALVAQYNTHADHSQFTANLGQDLAVSARIAGRAGGESSADLKVSDANFDYLLCLLSKSNCTDPSQSLRLRAEGKLGWRGWDWAGMSGAAQIRDLSLSKSGFLLHAPAPVEIKVQNGLADAGSFTLEGERGAKVSVQARGKVDGTLLDNHIRGSVPVKILEFVTPLIEEGRGRMDINLGLQGNRERASFDGRIAFQDGFLRLAGLDAPVESLNGALRFSDSRVTADSLIGQLGGGTAQVAGGLNLYLNRPPKFEIDLFLANNRLKFYPVNYAEISDAKLGLTGDHPPYLFGGTVHVKRVMMRNNFSVGAQKGLKNARYLPEKIGGSRALYETKLRAVADGGVFIENDLLNAEFRGELTLLNNFEYPQMIMRAELVRGKLIFRNTNFTLDHAFVRNPTPELFNPQFSLGGTASVDAYRITIFASGTADKPKITLSSTPAIPQEDIVSLLAFGYRGEDTKKLRSTSDSNNIAYSEVGSILLDQLQLNQNLQSKGLKFTLAPSVTNTEESLVHPQTATGQAAPKVYVQTQILKNLEASFGGTVGAAQGQAVDGRLEYRLGRKASVSAVFEQTPGLDATELRHSYGGDLKFRWGFR